MTHKPQVSHKHSHTLQQIFQHPASHNLEWHAVVALMKDHGSVREEHDGRLSFTLNGVTDTFHPAHGKKDVSEVQQVLDLRHFLERAGFEKDGSIGRPMQASSSTEGEEKEQHPHDHGHTHAEQSRRAELRLKAQYQEQQGQSPTNEGDATPAGAQDGSQGHGV